MKKFLKILIPIAIIIAIVVLAVTVYIMVAGVGGCPCNFINGRLKQYSISEDRKTVEFEITLNNPYQVTHVSWITVLVNTSENVEALKYNSTKNIWASENYTAEIIDRNNNSVVDSRDLLVVHSLLGKFSIEDRIGLRIQGYSRQIWSQVRLS